MQNSCACGDPVYDEGLCGVCFGRHLVNEGRSVELMERLSDIASFVHPEADIRDSLPFEEKVFVAPVRTDGTCIVKGCTRKSTFHDWCTRHTNLWIKTGDPRGRYGDGVLQRRLAYAEGDDIKVEDLFVRDRGVCGICGAPVDPSLRRCNPMMKSIDHIVPINPPAQSSQEPGSHTWANVQLAHLECNWRRGNRSARKMPDKLSTTTRPNISSTS